MMVVGVEDFVQIWSFDERLQNWVKLVETKFEDAITAVSWAPNLGRTDHFLACACQNGDVKILKFSQKNDRDSLETVFTDSFVRSHSSSFVSIPVCIFYSFCLILQICSVQWNVTGTCLCASSDRGVVRIYKQILEYDVSLIFTPYTNFLWPGGGLRARSTPLRPPFMFSSLHNDVQLATLWISHEALWLFHETHWLSLTHYETLRSSLPLSLIQGSPPDSEAHKSCLFQIQPGTLLTLQQPI
jgi:WD40 repeat protein